MNRSHKKIITYQNLCDITLKKISDMQRKLMEKISFLELIQQNE